MHHNGSDIVVCVCVWDWVACVCGFGSVCWECGLGVYVYVFGGVGVGDARVCVGVFGKGKPATKKIYRNLYYNA